MASSGLRADVRALQKVLAARHLIYQHLHNKQMSCPAMAQLLSNTLDFKRFFPYYSFNVFGGLDSEGKYKSFCPSLDGRDTGFDDCFQPKNLWKHDLNLELWDLNKKRASMLRPETYHLKVKNHALLLQ